MPSPVDKFFKQIKKDNPSYSDEQAWATAWSIYCKHVKPDSESCHMPTSEYLKDKSAAIVANVVRRFASAEKDFNTEAEARQSKLRSAEGDKVIKLLETLKKRIEEASASDQKKFDKAYDKILECGDAAAKAAEGLLKQYDDMYAGLSKEDKLKRNRDGYAETLGMRVYDWYANKEDHIIKKNDAVLDRMRQANITLGYAQELEEMLLAFLHYIKS